jgi:hypothetical protein
MERTGPGSDDAADFVSTRIIKSTRFEVDGAEFHWWAVGERPSLVTVRSAVFGTRASFTDDDPASFAPRLAKEVLREHYERAKALRRLFPKEPRPRGPSRA